MKDCTMGDLQKAREFAKKINMLDQFEETLKNLVSREERDTICGKIGDTEVELYSDRAPYSFLFVWRNKLDGRVLINGGMIFHGTHDGFGNGSAPTFSVCLTPTNGWSIHT